METGERGPAPLEMRAGLPAGSFGPFDFDKEFQNRHRVRPQDADKSWHYCHLSRGSSIVTMSPDQEIGPSRTEVPFPTSPTRGMEILRTPGVTTDQHYGPIPNWYRDSFYNIFTQPWESRPGEYETPFESQRSNPTYGYQSRLLPIGPPSDVTSTAGPPSTVGPSTSISKTTIPRKS